MVPATRFNILKVAPTTFFSDYGCHVRILEETLALQQLGSEVVICTYHGGRDWPTLDIRRIPRIPWLHNPQVGSSRHKLYLDVLLSLQTLGTSWQESPNIVHAHLHEGALIGYFISRVHRCPLVFDFQGSLTKEMIDHNFLRADSHFYKPLRRLEMVINRWADVIITSTAHAAELLVRQFGCAPAKIYPVPDCVNIQRFRPRWEVADELKIELKRQLGIPLERKLIVYLGLLAEYQGSGHLLQAAATLIQRGYDAHFLLMGFPGQKRYEALARSLGISAYVTFTGRLPYEDAPLYLALGDVAVAPKLSETEGNGKLLNYMAVGLPTVAFDTPVSREILGECGVYAEAGNAQALATAFESLLKDEREALERGRELRDRAVAAYSWEQAGRMILEVYERAAG
ncbi:MAG: glycosyltransferase family 4 protein [Chloroflexi bacterium]|nr:glycosyltransferase family 4 protein [Chloroflexota bacterium]MCL5074050.1 glycosyltransferase family 4 protein [Chloroflexota bacterium]